MPSSLRDRCLQGGGEALLGLLLSIAALLFCNQVVWMHPQSLLWANEIDIYGGQDLAGTLFLKGMSFNPLSRAFYAHPPPLFLIVTRLPKPLGAVAFLLNGLPLRTILFLPV